MSVVGPETAFFVWTLELLCFGVFAKMEQLFHGIPVEFIQNVTDVDIFSFS